MKIGLAQINTTVGDIPGNTAKIAAFLEKAQALGSDLVVFPELAVTGYPPRDLVDKRSLVAENIEALDRIAAVCDRAMALVGFVDRNASPVGKSVHNAAALVHRGRILDIYHKALLPTYDVFDEGRYFEPGDRPLVFECLGRRFGVTICEDTWIKQAALDRRLYRTDPLERFNGAGLDFLVNISASPFSLGKGEARQRIAAGLSGLTSSGFIYLNLVGGNDELIFDGGSFVVDREGVTRARALTFTEDLVVFDAGTGRGDLRGEAVERMSELAEALVLGLKDYVVKCGFSKVILGLSGGIDSAVTAALAVRALGPRNVLGVLMPSPFTGRDSVEDAALLASNLGIETITIPIAAVYRQYLESLEAPFAGTEAGVAEENIQARIRGNLLMAMSNKFGYLLVNTGNKSELAMGYCTLYGDMTGGLSVLGDVPKTMVYPLGMNLNAGRGIIPERVFLKAPSAELRAGQRDQDSLPAYEVLDPILKMYIEDNLEFEQIAAAGHPAALVADVIERVDRNEYKRRQAPPVLRVTSKAFGTGRRLPIAQKYRHRFQAG